MELAPIVLFVYNRPWHAQKTVEALRGNTLAKASTLYVYADGPKTTDRVSHIQQVRNYIRSITGFKRIEIIERDANMGLARSIIAGVSKVVNRHGKVIVLEDDCVTSPHFLNFMNRNLDAYAETKNIFMVGGHCPPDMHFPEDYHDGVFFAPRGCSWGWGTWKSRWEKARWFDNEYFSSLLQNEDFCCEFKAGGKDKLKILRDYLFNKIDTWDIQWLVTLWEQKGLTLFPTKTLVQNIGFDGSGTNCIASTCPLGVLAHEPPGDYAMKNPIVDPEILRQFEKTFHKSFFRKAMDRMLALRRRYDFKMKSHRV